MTHFIPVRGFVFVSWLFSDNVSIEDYNFACGSVWLRNSVSVIKEEHKLRVFENRILREIF
jgi:hypothetical protein